MNTIQNTTSTMSIVRKAIVLLTIATTLVGASFIGSPAVSAREGSLSTKDGCYIWIGNVAKPSAARRQVTVSVRCPFSATIRVSYVGLWKDVNAGADQPVGNNASFWGNGVIAANTTYSRLIEWPVSTSSTYGRFTFQLTRWTFPVVIESYANA